MDKKPLIAELIGTFALCYGGILSIMNAGTGTMALIPALAHGLILVVFISAFGHISGGHFNPAVTAGFMATKRMSVTNGVMYMAAQVVGGILGGIAIIASGYPTSIIAKGTPAPADGVSMLSAIVVEAILTFFLVTAVFGTAVDKRGPKLGGLCIGLTVTFDILAGGPITGGAMNPARWLGPTIVSMQNLGNAAIYLTGPFIGGIVAALVYDKVLAPNQPE